MAGRPLTYVAYRHLINGNCFLHNMLARTKHRAAWFRSQKNRPHGARLAEPTNPLISDATETDDSNQEMSASKI